MNNNDDIKNDGPQVDLGSTEGHRTTNNSVSEETWDLHNTYDGESPLPEPVKRLHAADCSILPVDANKKCALPGWKQLQEQKASLRELETWTNKYNPAGYAVVTGAISNRIVIDGDGPKSLDTFKAWGLEPHVITPRGGGHIHVTHPGWHVTTKDKLSDEYPNIDVRGDGGYALFYSHNENGEYENVGDEIVPVPFDDLPEELQALLAPKEATGTDGGNAPNWTLGEASHNVPAQLLLDRALGKVEEGESRNETGFWLACQLRDNGYSESEAKHKLLFYKSSAPSCNAMGDEHEYTTQEVLDTLRQVYSRDARDPWASSDEETQKESIGFELHTVKKFLDQPVPKEDWIIDRHVGTGGITLIAGPPKVGKTTLTAGLTHAASKGVDFLELKTRKVRTALFCFQERRCDIQERLRKFEIDEDVLVYEGSTRHMTDRAGALEQAITRYNLELVIIDTLANFWQIKDENNSIEVGKALQEIRDIARDTNCGIVLIHHTRKAGGSSGMGIRGSGDLLAEADNAIVLSRNGSNREIEVTSRWCDEYKLLIKLEGNRYVALGRPQSQEQSERQKAILDIISEVPGLSASKIEKQLLDRGHTVSSPTISRDLTTLKKAGEIEATGTKPYRYNIVTGLSDLFISL